MLFIVFFCLFSSSFRLLFLIYSQVSLSKACFINLFISFIKISSSSDSFIEWIVQFCFPNFEYVLHLKVIYLLPFFLGLLRNLFIALPHSLQNKSPVYFDRFSVVSIWTLFVLSIFWTILKVSLSMIGWCAFSKTYHLFFGTCIFLWML